jgi:hypothetical protein
MTTREADDRAIDQEIPVRIVGSLDHHLATYRPGVLSVTITGPDLAIADA